MSRGYEACPDFSYSPDLHLTINGQALGIAVITNITREKDEKTAEEVRKRRIYFKKKNYRVLWMIEERTPALDGHHQGLFLWRTEAEAANKTGEDRLWELYLKGLIRDEQFFRLYDFPVKAAHQLVDVRSLCHVRFQKSGSKVRIHRYLREGMPRMTRVFHLATGSEWPLTAVLNITDDKLDCGEPVEEKSMRRRFLQDYERRLTKRRLD
ncbi:hypothetical protein [Salisediminibacterium beveridgei]|uniref:Histidyl-tRNA synthetase n=1 Tax=Salisediminibacterium beveridgei TaxID=632773 RepID=A0A1D7QRX6_9BACI|nr:hypothetical protein [Salisediminibacterium beveridgei]AOM81741.1 histidyl-tRNA synthetase [Salisediminibacterium beveridgei]